MIHIFIVNPAVCEVGYAQKLRKELESYRNLSYYVFSTRRPGHERELVEVLCRFFDNEELRFYCCGGEGTLRNMLCGISDLSRTEVGLIPFGSSNFLKVFTDDQSHFRNLKSMIYGEVVFVDYIKSNLGLALNSISFGADTESLRFGEGIRSVGLGRHRFPFFLASLHAAFLAISKPFDIVVDNLSIAGEKTTLFFFGNGVTISGKYIVGISGEADDGYASYAFVGARNPFQKLKTFGTSISGNIPEFKKIAKCGLTKKLKARRSNGASFIVEIDGEIINATEIDAQIIRQGIKFVIPKRGV